MTKMKPLTAVAIGMATLFVTACGGGGGSGIPVSAPFALTVGDSARGLVSGPAVPAAYQCGTGGGLSNTSLPQLAFSNLPAGTASLVVEFEDTTLNLPLGLVVVDASQTTVAAVTSAHFSAAAVTASTQQSSPELYYSYPSAAPFLYSAFDGVPCQAGHSYTWHAYALGGNVTVNTTTVPATASNVMTAVAPLLVIQLDLRNAAIVGNTAQAWLSLANAGQPLTSSALGAALSAAGVTTLGTARVIAAM